MNLSALFPAPVGVFREKNPSCGIHWHDDFELITVLKGLLTLQIGFERFILNQGDTMIVNSLESHSLTSLKKDTEVLFLSLDRSCCLEINPFFYESIAILDYSVGFSQLQENRGMISAAVFSLLKILPPESASAGLDKPRYHLVRERMSRLMDLLSASYRPRILKSGALTPASEEKITMLYRMIHYLYQNYNKTPSLDDFLKKEHYSLYYMSHVIVEITGTSFRDWLTYVRVEESEKLLLSGDAPISCIAHQVGFSSVRYYNANFKKWYGLTPADFRRLFQTNYDGRLTRSSEADPSQEIGDLPEKKSFQSSASSGKARKAQAESGLPFFLSGIADTEGPLTGRSIRVAPEEEDPDSVPYPRQECVVSLDQLSLPGRWEHIAWAGKEIGLHRVRIIVPPDSSQHRLLKSGADPSSLFLPPLSASDPLAASLHGLKITAGSLEPRSAQKRKEGAFPLLAPVLLLEQLVTPEGRKTPEFFFYALLSRLRGLWVRTGPGTITAGTPRQFFIFALSEKNSRLHPRWEEIPVSIAGVSGSYKLASYTCDLDFFHSDAPVRDPSLFPRLTAEDYKSLNRMYEPRVTFETVFFRDGGETRLQLAENSGKLLVFTLLS